MAQRIDSLEQMDLVRRTVKARMNGSTIVSAITNKCAAPNA